MLKEFLREHFTRKNLSSRHHTSIVFVISQWQVDKRQPNLKYLFYRFLLAVFFATTWCLALIENPSSGTSLAFWSYTMTAQQFVLAFLMKLSFVLSTKGCKSSGALGCVEKLYPIYWMIHGISTAVGFVVSILFWCFVHESGDTFTAVEFFLHGSNSILILVDLCVIGHPIRILHFVYPIMLEVGYIVFSVGYYFYDTNRGGSGYLYEILNWADPLKAVLVVIVGLLLTISLHVLAYVIHTIKVAIHNKIYRQDTKDGQMVEQEEGRTLQ